MQTVSTTATQLEAVRAAVEPVVDALGLGLDLYDVELLGGPRARTLRVTVTGPQGVDLDTITAVTQAVSPILDDVTGLAGSYLLEVSSPGVERQLRRPEHFASAIGEQISVKYRTGEGPRRAHGMLRAFDGTSCTVETGSGEREEIDLADITHARTVFEWGPQPRPGKARARAKGKS